ncbi:MAG: hypothetical protein F4Y03_03985 [Alphaproteobacteria bacterium]|nr:hypothetical protein [Alphaproteobacteria bacterium]
MEPIYLGTPEADAVLASAPFETHARLTQIAMTEKPSDFIAERVMPSISTAFDFRYSKGITEDQYTVPETRASRAGRLTEVEFGQELDSASCEDRGLLVYVPERDIATARQQQSAWDPMAEASMGLTQLMDLDREVRVAGIVFDADRYPTDHKETLSGNGQFSNAASSPLKKIRDAKRQCITVPDTMVFGVEAWDAFCQHGDILQATRMTGAGASDDVGYATEAAVAALFGMRVVVGRERRQTANRGQASSFSFIWGKHIALVKASRPGGSRSQMPSWGFTARAMDRNVMTSMEPSRGVGRGSRVIKVSECTEEVVSWNTAGYFFEDAVA